MQTELYDRGAPLAATFPFCFTVRVWAFRRIAALLTPYAMVASDLDLDHVMNAHKLTEHIN